MRTLQQHWNGEAAKADVGYMVSIDHGRLRFNADFPEVVKGHPTAGAGQFTPELWKWDVAEVFIAGENGRYVEVNLAPSGAWWMQGFSDVRVADPDFSADGYSAEAEGGQWSCELAALEGYLGPSTQWRLNVTAITNTPDYHFLSLTELPGAEADFHQPSHFLPLEKVIETVV